MGGFAFISDGERSISAARHGESVAPKSEDMSTTASWHISHNGAQIPTDRSIVFGRVAEPPDDLDPSVLYRQLTSDSIVSRRHFRIDFVEGGVTVTDLGSANGTILERGEAQDFLEPGKAVDLIDADVVRVGPHAIGIFNETRGGG